MHKILLAVWLIVLAGLNQPLERKIAEAAGEGAEKCGAFVTEGVKSYSSRWQDAIDCVKNAAADGRGSWAIVFARLDPAEATGLFSRPGGMIYSFGYNAAGVCGEVGKCQPWFETGICATPSPGENETVNCT